MRIDIYKVTPSKDIYLGFKYFETRLKEGDTISYLEHDYIVLDSFEYCIYVKLIS